MVKNKEQQTDDGSKNLKSPWRRLNIVKEKIEQPDIPTVDVDVDEGNVMR